MKEFLVIFLPVLSLMVLLSATLQAAPGLRGNGASDRVLVRDGKVVLDYEKNEGDVIELEQARSPDFEDAEVRYRGADGATVLTGLAEGDYYFRVRGEAEEAWSNVVHAEVIYMGRGQLWVLLVTGFSVVAMTAGAIFWGHQRTKAEGTAR